MNTGRIAKRYARAIFEFAQEQGEEDRLYEEMKILADSYFSFHSLKIVMDNPTVTQDEKKKLLITAAGTSVSKTYLRMLDVVIDNKRESYMFLIALMYLDYYRTQKNMVMGRLTVAQSITDEVQEKLKLMMENDLQKNVDFIQKTDPSIIGGFILELNDNLLDASVKTQLNRLRSQLVNMNQNVI